MPRTTVAQGQDLVTPADVRAAMLATVRPLPPRPVRLWDAAGLVLAEPLVAPFSLPQFDNAAMDGFAIRSADTDPAPRTLAIVGRAVAGRPCLTPVTVGQAVSIATGAMMPDGADAVVAVEDATRDGDRVTVHDRVEAWRHVRRTAEDVQAGSTVLRAGAIVGPGQLAAAAAFGLDEIVVHPRARVAILATGDELRRAGDELASGQIYESVSAPLSALVSEAGGVPVVRPIARDEEADLERAIAEAAGEADAVVTVGGVSRGERDLIRTLRERTSVRMYQVALRPARPFAFGMAFGIPMFALPGNPAAALASFEELVRPVLLALMGKRPDVRPAVRATLTEPFVQNPGRLHLVRVEVWREQGALRARPAGRQGAGMLHSLARAQGWAVVPPEIQELPAGSEVDVRLLVDVG